MLASVLVVLVVAALMPVYGQSSSAMKCGTNQTNCQINTIIYPAPSIGLMITADFRVWRSADEGITWTMIARQCDEFIETSFGIYITGHFGNIIYYTTDYGLTITNITGPVGRVYKLATLAHPTMQGWILIVTFNPNTDPNVNFCSAQYTKDNGVTWTQVFTNNIMQGSIMWGNSTSQPDLLYLWRSDYAFATTTNYGVTYNVIFGDTLGFSLTNHYLFVGVVAAGGFASLYSSAGRTNPDHTDSSSYILADFPNGNKIPYSFFFLDDATRTEFIGIQVSPDDNYGNVFTSLFDGVEYQLAIGLVHQDGGNFDFHRVHGLDGIYIANTIPRAFIVGNPPTETFVTYSNGASWGRFVAPPVDYYGNATCPGLVGQRCLLHLHGETALNALDLPPWYTRGSALGLIIGNGNTGANLIKDPAAASTWLSRNAGLNWTQIFPSSTIYALSDDGGILLIAPYSYPVNYVLYSLDQGLSFVSFNFTSPTAPIFVTGIFTSFFGSGLRFTIEGVDSSDNGYIFGIDLTNLGIPNCTVSDYEAWAPQQNFYSNCFMGAVTFYQRRKQTSKCYNIALPQVLNQTACPCTYSDYECLTNYQPVNFTGFPYSFACAQVTPDPVCTAGQTYVVPTGYALVPETQCQGGLNLLGATKTCPSKSHPGEIAAAVIVSVLVVGSIVALSLLYWKNERFRNWVSNLKNSVPGRNQYTEINQ